MAEPMIFRRMTACLLTAKKRIVMKQDAVLLAVPVQKMEKQTGRWGL